eukprot:366284-Chlamydomonas_euryale.AAC.3
MNGPRHHPNHLINGPRHQPNHLKRHPPDNLSPPGPAGQRAGGPRRALCAAAAGPCRARRGVGGGVPRAGGRAARAAACGRGPLTPRARARRGTRARAHRCRRRAQARCGCGSSGASGGRGGQGGGATPRATGKGRSWLPGVRGAGCVAVGRG